MLGKVGTRRRFAGLLQGGRSAKACQHPLGSRAIGFAPRWRGLLCFARLDPVPVPARELGALCRGWRWIGECANGQRQDLQLSGAGCGLRWRARGTPRPVDHPHPCLGQGNPRLGPAVAGFPPMRLDGRSAHRRYAARAEAKTGPAVARSAHHHPGELACVARQKGRGQTLWRIDRDRRGRMARPARQQAWCPD